ncbi:hypothetical protein Bca4012_029448 [Brassica carinata]
MGRCGVIASLLRLLLKANDNGIVFRRIWVKCLWSLVRFGSSIRIGLARLGGVEISAVLFLDAAAAISG